MPSGKQCRQECRTRIDMFCILDNRGQCKKHCHKLLSMYMAVGISGFSHLNNKIGELISCHSFFAAG